MDPKLQGDHHKDNKGGSSIITTNPASEIYFNYVPKKTVPSNLSITNISQQRVAFKIRTNQPNSYIVRPSEGIIEIGNSININILMQPTDYNPQTNIINDKFQIVACPIDDNMTQQRIIELLKNINNPNVQVVKLKVVLKTDSKPLNLSGSLSGLSNNNLDTSTNANKPISSNIMSSSGSILRKSVTENIINYNTNSTSANPITKDDIKTAFFTAPSNLYPANEENNNLNNVFNKFSSPKLENSRSSSLNTFQTKNVDFIDKTNPQPQRPDLLANPPTEQSAMVEIPLKSNKQPDSIVGISSPDPKPIQFASQSGVNDNSGALLTVQLQNECKKLTEKCAMDEALISGLLQDKSTLTKEVESLKIKVKEQEEILFNLSKERNEMKAELTNLRNSTMKYNQIDDNLTNGNIVTDNPFALKTYQLWHVIIVAIFAMILGAFLSS